MPTPPDFIDDFETPVYAYDALEVEARCRELRDLTPEGAQVFFSLKANPLPGLGKIIAEFGYGCEVASSGELAAAGQAGFPLDRTLFGGPGKSAFEIEQALKKGVRFFSVESANEVRMLAEIAPRFSGNIEILLRLNPSEGGNARLAMSGTASQFGIPEDQIDDVRAVELPDNVVVRGIHIYMGTQSVSAEAIVDNTRLALELGERVAELFEIERPIINAGGGFPWPYARNAEPTDLSDLKPALAQLWQDSPLSKKGSLVFETGRFLVGSSGTFWARILDIKESGGKTFAVLDGGINHLGGMSGLGRLAMLEIEIAVNDDVESGKEQEPKLINFVGPLCTPLDHLNRKVETTRELQRGTLIAVPNTGAYGLTASLIHFLSFPPAAEVVFRSDTKQIVSAWRLNAGHSPISLPDEHNG